MLKENHSYRISKPYNFVIHSKIKMLISVREREREREREEHKKVQYDKSLN